MNTHVYIDGFNFYYGCVRHTEFRWLDFRKLVALLIPKAKVQKIYYFTAKIKGDSAAHNRQQIYIRALRNYGIEVIYGHFSKRKERRYLVHFPKKETLIWNIEEKGSDVNIACRMLIDAYEDRCEQIILISNDSDLLSPIKIVKKLKKRVALILPIAKREHTASKVLSDEAHIVRKVNFAHLRKSQLPEKIAHTISKPP